MQLPYVRDLVVLFLGDVVVFAVSLWFALVLRHFVAPNAVQYFEHLLPFAALFALWILVFVSVGLYDRTVALFEHRLPVTIFEAQVVNAGLAVLFFFVLPIGIQPKTILVLYFLISTALIVVWRLGVFRLRSLGRVSENVLIVGSGPDIEALAQALRTSPHTALKLIDVVDEVALSPELVRARVLDALARTRARIVIRDPRLASVVTAADIPGVLFLDALEVYEALYARTPLTLIDARHFEQAPSAARALHDTVKRLLDIVLSVVLLTSLAVLAPLIWCLTRLEGPGPLFITQERVGKGWRHIRIYKLRTMTQNDAASHTWVGETANRVTRLGALLRRTSIDELPQVFSVLIGELSLIGPRSDIWGLGERLKEEIPLYHVRYLVTPGISGWAQVNQQYAPGQISPQSIEDSRVRLMYDLYYVRHRSVFLDLSIVAKTATTLLTRLIP